MYLFIYCFWLCWVFMAVQAFLYLWGAGASLELWCAVFSLQWLRLLWSMALGHAGFSTYSTSTWAE